MLFLNHRTLFVYSTACRCSALEEIQAMYCDIHFLTSSFTFKLILKISKTSNFSKIMPKTKQFSIQSSPPQKSFPNISESIKVFIMANGFDPQNFHQKCFFPKFGEDFKLLERRNSPKKTCVQHWLCIYNFAQDFAKLKIINYHQ